MAGARALNACLHMPDRVCFRRRLRLYWQSRLERLRGALADVENTPGLGLLCALGAITGGLCGVVILGLHSAIRALRVPLFEVFAGRGSTFVDAQVMFRLAVPVLGALLIGLIVEKWLQNLENGIVHIIERLTFHQGVLPLRAAIVDFLLSAIAIASGQSVGREGAAAHTGAATGSWLGQRLALPNNSVRTLVGCGTAAGIAASFNTPLAAVIFAMEVVMMEYTIAGFAPIMLAAVGGSLVTFTVTHVQPRLFAGYSGFHELELPYLVLVGAILGLIGGGFTRLSGLCMPYTARLRVSLRMTLAGGVTAALAVFYPQIMGLGFTTVNAALAGQFALGLAAGIGLAKLTATLFAVAAAIPGGVILPMIVAGATLGSALGSLGAAVLPGQVSGAGLYALLGIGAMMAAVLQAPLSALVAIVELSGQTEMVLPGMLAVITALVVSRRVAASDSLFRLLLRRRGFEYRNDPVSQYLRRTSALSTMNRRFRICEPKMPRAAIANVLEQRIDWLLIRVTDNRSVLIRAGELARLLAGGEPGAADSADSADSANSD